MTNELIDFITGYLKSRFDNDNNYGGLDFNVVEAFDYNEELDCPQIAIQILENSENEQYTSFEAENVSDFGLQFNIYAETTQIGDNIYSPSKSSSMIAEKLKEFMNDIKFKQYNKNIVRLVRTGLDFRAPVDETGSAYVNVIRYDCQTVYPYNIELENYKGE